MLIFSYLSTNFITLTLLVTVLVMMLVNRKLKIPATQMLYAAIAVIFALSVLAFFDDYLAGAFSQKPSFDTIWPRTVTKTLIYSLRPLVILPELLVILPNRRSRLFCAAPAIINTAVYATALFGSDIAFSITENGWSRGALGLCVYVVQVVYVMMLLICSLYCFGRGNKKHSAIILLIVLMALVAAVMEYHDILNGYTMVVSAMCVLFYYFYLAFVHQKSMQETIEKKELDILEQELTLLRGQIDPVFISDSLNCIRSLAKTDKKAASAAVDNFSVYLRAHMNAIRNDEPISIETELDCVRAYLSLLQVREQRTVELVSDLPISGFSLPPLTLEAVVTYCADSVQSSEQRISIRTAEDAAGMRILVSSVGMANGSTVAHAIDHNALENACRRLEMQCGGTLTAKSAIGAGTTLTIIIPAEKNGAAGQ